MKKPTQEDKKKQPEDKEVKVEKTEKAEKVEKSEKSGISKKLKFILILVLLYLLDFYVKIIVYSIDKQLTTAEKAARRVDDVEVVLDSFKIWAFILSIVGLIIAGIVDHYNFILYANIAGLGVLTLVVVIVGTANAPFTDISYNIETVLLYISHVLLFFNIIFEPIRTVLILKQFNLPENLRWLIVGIGILWLLRNLAVVIVALSMFFESPWAFFSFNVAFLLILIALIALLVYFKDFFLSTSPIPFLPVLKCYWQAIVLKFKRRDNSAIVVQNQKWTDRVVFQPEEIRESTRLMASIALILSLFFIMSAFVQIIYDAYNYQIEINSSQVWIAKLHAEQIVAGMNIINILFLVIVSLLLRSVLISDLKRILASFLSILIAGCMFIYIQNDLDKNAVILPEARSAKITFYNAMNSSVLMSSAWTRDVLLNAYTSRSFFVRGWGHLHTLMFVTNYEEGFEMRMTKDMNKENSRTSYTKTIFARELETTSYVVSNLGLVKTAGFKGKESLFYKTLSYRVARVLILSSMSWYLVPAVLYIKGAGADVSMAIPDPDGKKLIGLYQANYNYEITSQEKIVSLANSSFDVKSLGSYTVIYYERPNEDKIRMLIYVPTNPKLRHFEVQAIHFIGLYFLSLGLSVLQIWLTRFIFVESSVATRCFLFAFFSLMWIVGPSLYFFGLFLWRGSTFLIIMLAVIVLYIFDFVGYTFLIGYFKGQTNLEEKTN